jgi:hypothetical protein
VLPYQAYVRQRWYEGFYNKLVLWKELQAQGYTGSLDSVRRFLRHFPQPESNVPIVKTKLVKPPKLTPPVARVRLLSARRAAWLLMMDESKFQGNDSLTRQLWARQF